MNPFFPPSTVMLTVLNKVPIDAWCISGDGQTVGGRLNHQAAIWSKWSGLVLLPLPPPLTNSQITSVSDNGSVVAGISWTDSKCFICAWKGTNLMFTIPTEILCSPHVSADGTTVVGDLLVGSVRTVAFRWRAKSGVKWLSDKPGIPAFHAITCSGNGDLVYGCETTDLPLFPEWQRTHLLPCIWGNDGSLEKLSVDQMAEGPLSTCSQDGRRAMGLVRLLGLSTISENGTVKLLPLRDGRAQSLVEDLYLTSSGNSGYANLVTPLWIGDRRSSVAATFQIDNPLVSFLYALPQPPGSGTRPVPVDVVFGCSDDGSTLLGCQEDSDGSTGTYIYKRQSD